MLCGVSVGRRENVNIAVTGRKRQLVVAQCWLVGLASLLLLLLVAARIRVRAVLVGVAGSCVLYLEHVRDDSVVPRQVWHGRR
jgi:hypothetical protein